jgi:hypothetical protein
LLGNSSVWEEENCLSSAAHPLWPRILKHVYKKAMRDLPMAPLENAYRLDSEGDKKLRIPVPRCPLFLSTKSPLLEGAGSYKEATKNSSFGSRASFTLGSSYTLEPDARISFPFYHCYQYGHRVL